MSKRLSEIIPAFSVIFLGTIILFLPIFRNPDLFLNRNNDLTEFFWPVYFFVKNQILNYHSLPLWNNLFLSGTPLLPDPQAPLFYPPNLIYLFLNLDTAFIVSSFLHVFVGGIFTYFVARHGFNFSQKISLFVALLYPFNPKITAYLEAGHIGLVAATAWLPLVLFSIIVLIKKPTITQSILLALAMTGLFFTHSVTFLVSGLATLLIFPILFLEKTNYLARSLIYFFVGAIFAISLCAITLLPQISWSNLTTRTLLTTNPQIYPIWESKQEFIKAIFFPQLKNNHQLFHNTEKWIFLGISTSILAFFGLLKLSKKYQIIILLVLSFLVLFALGNISPFYSLLINQSWYSFIRVTTRVWFLVIFTFIYLAGFALKNLKFSKTTTNIIIILTLAESLFYSYAIWQKPINQTQNTPQEFYEIFRNDHDLYRIICLSHCISQKDAALNGLQLVDGYSTLTQTNYYQHSWQLTGGFWDYYSLTTPPTGISLFQDLQPSAEALAIYNTKYVISNHSLTDPAFNLLKTQNGFHLYQNTLLEPRSNGEIIFYSPNLIKINTEKLINKPLIVSEVFSPGWNAYLNGSKKVNIQETPDSLRLIDLPKDSRYVDLKYEPSSYFYGKIITLITIIIIMVCLINQKYYSQTKFLTKKITSQLNSLLK